MKTNFILPNLESIGTPNFDLIKKCLESIFLNDENEFMLIYNNLNNTDKYYTLSVFIKVFTRIEYTMESYVKTMKNIAKNNIKEDFNKMKKVKKSFFISENIQNNISNIEKLINIPIIK
jgi:hypothetical protein